MIPGCFRRIASRLRPHRHETPAMRRMREISDLHKFAVAAYRQRMRREHPEAGKREIDAMVWAWLSEPEPPPRGFVSYPAALCRRCKRLLAERSPGVWSCAAREGGELPADQCTPGTPHEPDHYAKEADR